MAANLLLKRAKVLEIFSQRFLARTYCIAAANTENKVEDLLEDVSEQKKGKKKDLAKSEAYEVYRNQIRSMNDEFKKEYRKRKEKDKKRLEEINEGSFSPHEQHKKAIQDIEKYNKNKENARMVRNVEKKKRMQEYYEKQKEEGRIKQLERNRENVLKVIGESKSFVTMDNLEEKIQEVLSEETNYNFAITPYGRKIFSREPPNNFVPQGPGPMAYKMAGRKFPYKESGNWRNQRRPIRDEHDTSSDESSDSSDDEN